MKNTIYKHVDNPLFLLERYCAELPSANEEIYLIARAHDTRCFNDAAAAAVELNTAMLQGAPKQELQQLEERLEELTLCWESACEFSRLRRRAIELQDEYGQRTSDNMYPITL